MPCICKNYTSLTFYVIYSNLFLKTMLNSLVFIIVKRNARLMVLMSGICLLNKEIIVLIT
jgi:hypothetical protein